MKGGLIVILIAGAIAFFLLRTQAEKTLEVTEEGMSAIEKAKNSAQFAGWSHITQALSHYVNDHGRYPERIEELLPHYIRGEHYLCDPWGNRVKYEQENGAVTLRSSGPDGEFFTEDDLTRTL